MRERENDKIRAPWLLEAALRAWPLRMRASARRGIIELHAARVADARAASGRMGAAAVAASDIIAVLAAGLRARRASGLAPRRYPAELRDRSGIEKLRQDLRFAAGTMVRRPGTPLLALLTCALGIGSATAMYSIVDGVLLRPLPFEGADRLVSVYPTIEEWRTNSELAESADRGAFSHIEFVEWQSRQQSFEAAAATSGGRATLTGGGPPAQVQLSSGTIDLFRMLRVKAAAGRLFVEEDWQPNGSSVVLSNEMWRTRFGSSMDIIGRSIDLNGTPRKVIGVLPADFAELHLTGDVWSLSGGPGEEAARNNHMYRVMAMLKPGVSISQATAETSSILKSLSRAAEHDITHFANITTRLSDQTRDVRYPLLLLLSATGILLLAACINVAGLLLGAGIDRSAELAVRSALGAGRARLTRQLMTESLLLACLGGMAGVAMAFGIKRLLLVLAPEDMPRIAAVGIDLRVLAFAAACTCTVGLLFGLVPAISLSRTRLADRMGSARITSSARARLHGGLVTLQLALAMLLLGGAGLLVRTVLTLGSVDPGFDAEPLLAVQIAPRWDRMRELTPAQIAAYYENFRTAIAAVPGVEDVALTSLAPFTGSYATNEIVAEGYTPAPGEMVVATRYYVSGNYFDVMQMSVIEGRALGPLDDRMGAQPVMVVSQRMARRFWPSEKAVGKKIEHFETSFTIVGVVPDARDLTLADDDAMRFYMAANAQERVSGGSFLVRTRGEPGQHAAAVRTAIWGIDPDLPITRTEPMTELIQATLAPQKFRARLITAFAILALLFSLLGVYGVVNRAVSGRMREMGLRMALGARPVSLVLMVLGQGMRLSLAGVVVGLIALAAVTRLIGTLLYGTAPLDPFALVTVASLLVVLALIAVLPPSLRAARAVALTALRSSD